MRAPKKALPSLPFEAEEPLKAKIEEDALIITEAKAFLFFAHADFGVGFPHADSQQLATFIE